MCSAERVFLLNQHKNLPENVKKFLVDLWLRRGVDLFVVILLST